MAMSHFTAFFADAVNALANEKKVSVNTVLQGLAVHIGATQAYLTDCYNLTRQMPIEKLRSVITYHIPLLKKKTQSYKVLKSDVSESVLNDSLKAREEFSLFEFLYKNPKKVVEEKDVEIVVSNASLSTIDKTPITDTSTNRKIIHTVNVAGLSTEILTVVNEQDEIYSATVELNLAIYSLAGLKKPNGLKGFADNKNGTNRFFWSIVSPEPDGVIVQQQYFDVNSLDYINCPGADMVELIDLGDRDLAVFYFIDKNEIITDTERLLNVLNRVAALL